MSGFALPAEGAEGASLSPFILCAALAAAALLFFALRQIGRRDSLRGLLLGAAGLALAIGAALCVHDAVAMPEIAGTLIIGGGAGYLAARQVRRVSLNRLSAILRALTGLAALLTAIAAWMNPGAFGIADDVSGKIASVGLAGILVGLLLGGGMFIGAAALLLHPMAPARLHWLLGSVSGWASAAFGFAFGNLGLILCGALLGVAGVRLFCRVGCRADHLH